MSRSAALFIDYENIFYFLKNTADLTDEDTTDATLHVLAQLIDEARSMRDHDIVLRRAFLDTERVRTDLRRLTFLGIKVEHVTSSPQKSSADICLSLDVLDLMYTRREIETYYIVGGDRDYLQICRRLRESLKDVHVAGFDRSLSGELRELVGEPRVILCDRLVGDLAYAPRTLGRPPNGVPSGMSAPPAPVSISSALAAPAPMPPTARRPVSLDAPPSIRSGTYDLEEGVWEERAIHAILRFMASKNVEEVWLRPFLTNLDHEEEFASITASQRRSVINRLSTLGVIELEKRRGTQSEYSVLHLRREHPLVQKVLSTMAQSTVMSAVSSGSSAPPGAPAATGISSVPGVPGVPGVPVDPAIPRS